MKQEKLFKIGNNDYRPGIITFPESSIIPCALLVFNHGVGEAGDGTLSGLWKLTANPDAIGPLGYAGNYPIFSFKSPIDGITYPFITLSLQGVRGWCCTPEEVYNAIEIDVKKNWNINPNAVFITGLSAGGACTADFISSDLGAICSAAVPMSQASQGRDIMSVVRNDIRVWSFCGDVDWSYRTNVETFAKKINDITPGRVKTTIYSGGHGGWSKFYDPAYKEEFVIDGKKVLLNMYEWFLANIKGQTAIVEPSTTTTSTTTTTTTTKTEEVPLNIVLPSKDITTTDSELVLDASGSTGWKVMWWDIVTAPAGSKAAFESYAYSNPIWKIKNLSKGTYTLRIWVQNKYGYKLPETITLKVVDSITTTTTTTQPTTTTTTSTTTTTTTTKPAGGGEVDIANNGNVIIGGLKKIKSITIEFEDGSVVKY